MRKIIAAINSTLDGICDHTAGIPDAALHAHYTELLNNSDVIFYGRKTYELMRFWQSLLLKPSGQPSMDQFALAIDKIPKIVLSQTLKTTGWDTATLATKELAEELAAQQRLPGQDILIGSRSLITQLLNVGMIDEFQFCLHPIIAGSGLPLFADVHTKKMFRLLKTKTFDSGVMVLYYQPQKV